MSIVIRSALTAALLVGVYTETGKWTTLAIALGTIGTELNTFLIKRLNRP